VAAELQRYRDTGELRLIEDLRLNACTCREAWKASLNMTAGSLADRQARMLNVVAAALGEVQGATDGPHGD
jgi:hypothetical protein